MAISIRSTLKNVSSDKYNKTNIFYFIILSLISTILGSFIPEDKDNLIQINSIIITSCYFVISYIINGFYITSLNNAIKNRNGIVANIINDIDVIFHTALKSTVGGGINTILMGILLFIVFNIFFNTNKYLGIIFTTFILVLFCFLYIGLFLNFSITLKYTEWFSYKKALHLINLSKSKFFLYIFKILIIILLGIICAFIPAFIFTIIIKLLSIFSVIDQSLYNQIIKIIYSIINGIIIGIFSIYSIDLSAQYIKEVKEIQE